MVGKPVPIAQRFESKYVPEPNSGCWLWLGAVIKSRRGGLYGVIGRDAQKRILLGGSNDLAYRVSYELYKGSLTANDQVDHTCQNTLCVNPAHLEKATAKENTNLAYSRLYGNACKRGHVFDSKNTWVEKNGQRHCRRCHAVNEARKRALKKESFVCL